MNRILNNFFILVGGIAISAVSFLKNVSFENIFKRKENDDNECLSKIFNKLNFETAKKTSKNDDFIDKIRDKLMPVMLKESFIKILIALSIIMLFILPLELVGIFLTILTLIYTLLIYYPKIKQQKSYSDLNQELPYALRHMGIELKSGKGLHDALITIRDANYGSFSNEITRVLEEVKFGKSTEDSLLEMSKRIKSEGLTRAIQQIVGTLRVGGSLANSLEIIAKDMSFEMQIKLKEYSQRLNSFILIYTFIAILAPVISLIMLMAGSTVMGDVISSNLLLVIYSLFFPMIVMFMGIFIKKLEPSI